MSKSHTQKIDEHINETIRFLYGLKCHEDDLICLSCHQIFRCLTDEFEDYYEHQKRRNHVLIEGKQIAVVVCAIEWAKDSINFMLNGYVEPKVVGLKCNKRCAERGLERHEVGCVIEERARKNYETGVYDHEYIDARRCYESDRAIRKEKKPKKESLDELLKKYRPKGKVKFKLPEECQCHACAFNREAHPVVPLPCEKRYGRFESWRVKTLAKRKGK